MKTIENKKETFSYDELLEKAIINEDLKTLNKMMKYYDNEHNYYMYYMIKKYRDALIKANNNDINAILDIIEMTCKREKYKDKAILYINKAEEIIKTQKIADYTILHRLNDFYFFCDMFDKFDDFLENNQNKKLFIKAEKDDIPSIDLLMKYYQYLNREKYLYYVDKLDKAINKATNSNNLGQYEYDLVLAYDDLEDREKANFYLEKAVKHEYREAIFYKACNESKDTKEKISLLKKILSMPYCQNEKTIIGQARGMLARIYLKDEEYKDCKLAIDILKEGIKHKETNPYAYMSDIYLQDKYVEHDYKLAKHYYKLFNDLKIKEVGDIYYFLTF